MSGSFPQSREKMRFGSQDGPTYGKNVLQIKQLDTALSTRRAGKNLVVLREPAAEFDESISRLS
jgi:hypothetical protein